MNDTNTLTPEQAMQAWLDGKPIEAKYPSGKWVQVSTPQVLGMYLQQRQALRLKPKEPVIIEINGVTFQRGEVDAPPEGTEYYRPNIEFPDESGTGGTVDVWDDSDWDRRWLNTGLVHLTQEAAIAHAKALVLLSGGKLA